MDRYDPLNAAEPGEPYRNADSDVGDEGSYPDALGFDATQTEITNAITALGGVPSKESWSQLGERIIAYVGTAITTLSDAVTTALAGKVAKAGDTMTGSLTNHSVNNAATGVRHIMLTRGDGTGKKIDIVTIGDTAQGAVELGLRLLDAAGTGILAQVKLVANGDLLLNGNPTGALAAATKQYVDAVVITPDATTGIKGKAALLIASEIDTGSDTQKVATAAAIAGSKRTVKAWWYAGGDGTLFGSFGVSSFVRNSIGNYTVNLSSAAPSTIFGAVAISGTNITTEISRSSSSYTFRTGAGASYNAGDAPSSGMIVF